MSGRLVGHTILGGATLAVAAYNAYVWFVYPGWREATRNALAMQDPTFLPLAVPLGLWVLFALHHRMPYTDKLGTGSSTTGEKPPFYRADE